MPKHVNAPCSVEPVLRPQPPAAVIPFDWAKPPLNLNDRGHWAKRSPVIADVRQAAMLLCRSKINRGELKPGEPVEVTLVWYAPDRIRRDADNPVATLKPICDGLVDAGLVPDDTPEWMDKRPVRIVYRKGQPGVELHIETRAEVVERVARAIHQMTECDPFEDYHPSHQAKMREVAAVAVEAAGRFAALPPSV